MKKLLAILLAVTLVLSLAACGTAQPENTTAPKQETEAKQMSFTVTVVHADESTKDFTYTTDAEKLGDYLEDQGLIDSEGADPGMFHTVDGEKADWNVNQSYWALYIGEEYAMSGIFDTPITDGAVYKLVYTIG